MGLDITAYTKLTKLDGVLDADGQPIMPYARLWVNNNFPGRDGGIDPDAVYGYDDAHEFKAGGYIGYAAWRDKLAKLAGYPQHEFQNGEISHAASAWVGKCDGMPFVELVNFSDCEGVIGTGVSAKLARDFAEFDDRAKATGDERFYGLYCKWRKAFEMAADGGAVCFH